MKKDKIYSHIYVCPVTHDQVTFDQKMYSRGVCHVCGHNDRSTITHALTVSGKWVRPSFLEWIKGHREYFVYKDEE